MKGLHDIGEVVIKPTVESGSGRGVRFVRLKNGVDVFEGETLEEVLRQYGKMDIAIQECVKPAESLKSIYPYAINTFRIMTYICIKLFGYMAAGYTTLVCYMLYTVAHYCFAQKICNEEMNGVRIYNLKTLLTITGAFMISGFLLMMTYNAPVIRYGLLVIAGVLAVLNRNKIIALLKSLIAMKKA